MQNQPLLDSCVPGSMPHLMIRKGSCVWASREWSMLESSACADYQTFVVQDGVAQRKGRGTMPEYKGYWIAIVEVAPLRWFSTIQRLDKKDESPCDRRDLHNMGMPPRHCFG
jgi:hypothetical protein